MRHVFDFIADSYDRWYDTPYGDAIFRAERDCLRALHGGPYTGWLEVGVGTGRFAHALGIRTGIDPSGEMLGMAASRGVEVCEGTAEHLPFQAGSFVGVLMALTLCFVVDPRQALSECRRVLRPDGWLLLGTIPADSEWGRAYMAKAAAGHAAYRHARFQTAGETVDVARRAGFVLLDTAGTLFWKPGETPGANPQIRPLSGNEAGFVGLLLRKDIENRS